MGCAYDCAEDVRWLKGRVDGIGGNLALKIHDLELCFEMVCLSLYPWVLACIVLLGGLELCLGAR